MISTILITILHVGTCLFPKAFMNFLYQVDKNVDYRYGDFFYGFSYSLAKIYPCCDLGNV